MLTQDTNNSKSGFGFWKMGSGPSKDQVYEI